VSEQGLAVTLLTPEQDEIWRKEGLGPGLGPSVEKLMCGGSGGRYCVAVEHGQGQYLMDVSLDSWNDAGSGADAPREPTEALELEAGQAYSGRVGEFDERDWHRLAPAEGQSLTLTARDEAHDMTVVVQNFEGEEIWHPEGLGTGDAKTCGFSEVAGQPYRLQVAYGGGTYGIKLE
jgi:hypothetical protein